MAKTYVLRTDLRVMCDVSPIFRHNIRGEMMGARRWGIRRRYTAHDVSERNLCCRWPDDGALGVLCDMNVNERIFIHEARAWEGRMWKW